MNGAARPTRIAVVAPYPRTSTTHSEHALGGVAAYAKNLVDELRKEIDVLVLAPRDDPEPGARHEGNVEIVEFQRSARGIAKALRELKRDPTIEAVHVQFEQHLFGGPLQNARLAMALRSLRAKKRVVLSIHQVPDLAEVDRPFLARNGFPPIPFVAKLWMRIQYMLLAAACDLALVHEERMRDLLDKRYHVDPSRVAVVPHGIDAGVLPCDQAEAKRRLGADGRFVVLYFGYVTGYKGVDLLADAIAKIPADKRASMRVIIAGKVPDRKMENDAFRNEIEALESRIAKLAPCAERKGFLSPEEISLHLAAADIVVFPYRNVFGASGPLSITIGHGRPFLASSAFRGMGVPEEATFPRDPDALAQKLLAIQQDPGLRGRIEKDARRMAIEHSWPNVARRTAEHYALPKRRAKVLLMGAYGQDNLGDEALLEVHLQQLRAFDITVGSTNPRQTTQRYGVPAVRTYGGLRTINAFIQSDAVVFGGGSVMKELPWPYARHRVVASLALLSTFAHGLGRGVAYSAVGVEKLDTPAGRVLARQGMRAADLVQVRDEGSRRLLASIGAGERATLVADAAYLLEEDEAAAARADELLRAAQGRPVIVVNPIASREVQRAPNDVAVAFAGLIDQIVMRMDAHVLLLPFKTAGDDSDMRVVEDVLRRVAHRANVSVAPSDLRPSEALAVLRRARFCVAMRHHAVLLSLVAGAPVLAVPYAPKTEHLVEEFGLHEAALSVADLDARSLSHAFWKAYEARSEQTLATRKQLGTMRARASDNFERLRAFLLSRER